MVILPTPPHRSFVRIAYIHTLRDLAICYKRRSPGIGEAFPAAATEPSTAHFGAISI